MTQYQTALRHRVKVSGCGRNGGFMELGGAVQSSINFLQLVQQELLLFAAFWFLLGAIDDLAVDFCWLRFKLTGRARTERISHEQSVAPLQGRAAVLIAAWQEDQVIGHTIRHALAAWQQEDFTLYIGCYHNDPATIAAAMAGAGNDPRIRLIVHENAGPTTKADCLNRVYAALCEDEQRYGCRFRSIILHDSEQVVSVAQQNRPCLARGYRNGSALNPVIA